MSAGVVADTEWRQILAGGCAAAVVLLIARVLLLTRELTVERARRSQEAELAAARGAEVTHLAAVRVPAIAEHLRTGQRLEGYRDR
ncbi:hypothetical protein NKH18_06195 [Streptomyces sp. M10(2022)]